MLNSPGLQLIQKNGQDDRDWMSVKRRLNLRVLGAARGTDENHAFLYLRVFQASAGSLEIDITWIFHPHLRKASDAPFSPFLTDPA